ncbi:MAG: nucleotide exchange factor GrpE [Deltaproteobacteria bacterium]|nr:nucleotide exchange factor GrpE [Deltaproteobacteria bacterium]
MDDKEQKFTSIESVQEGADAEHMELAEGAEKKEDAITLLQKEIDQIKCVLDEKTRECEENYKRFLLSSADLNNYRKRTDREKEDLITFANERLIKELIVVVDNLERALEHINADADFNALRDGVKLTLDQFLVILKKFGLEQISSVGERFDPCKHEAINQEESKDHDFGIVIKEYQKGYFLKERLLRPAMVVVNKKSDGV